MLSRVAENLYWMARYIERAEDTARLLSVNSPLMLDLPGPLPLGWAVWKPLPHAIKTLMNAMWCTFYALILTMIFRLSLRLPVPVRTSEPLGMWCPGRFGKRLTSSI